MKGKELKALITLAGKIDPSVQVAMLKAANQGKKSSSLIQKAFGSANKGILKLAGKISPAFQKQLSKVEANASKIFGKVQKGAGKLGKGFQTAGRVAGKVAVGIGAVAGVATAAVAPLAKSGLEYASSLTEVQNVVDTTFGKNSTVVDQFAKTTAKTYGMSELQTKQYTSTLGAMYKSMGLSSQQTLAMSQNMTALSGDMASFYNLDPAEAFEKIRAGVSGETEPLKQLGINMSEANLSAFALSKGIKTQYKDMTQAQQAELRYNYLLNVTKDAQGDFARTSGSFANQQRLLKMNLQQVAGTIMSKMVPALGEGLQKINSFISGLDTNAVGAFVGQIANMAVQFLPLVMQILPLFGNLLQMVVPPLIQIGQQIMPVVIQVIQTVLTAIKPLIPPILQFVQMLLPPLVQILTAVSPLLIQLANIISAILGPALSFVAGLIQKLADIISAVAKPIGEFFGKIGSFLGIGGGDKSISVSAKVPKYATGGFADRPSIFGEAGLEAAIPIRPGSARSIGLLIQTARMLGMKDRYGAENPGGTVRKSNDDKVPKPHGSGRPIIFNYAPVFHGEHPTDSVLKRNAQDVKRVLDDYFGERERLAWEL